MLASNTVSNASKSVPKTEAKPVAPTTTKRHPMIERAKRETGYLVWTNIGC